MMDTHIEQGRLARIALQAAYEEVRGQSVALAAVLSAEDCCAQSMPDASPVKWHLAHTTWFFETFILERHEPEFCPYHPAFRMLFNSYYNGIGAKHVRAQRGLLTRPAFDEVLAYRRAVDARMARLIERRLHAAPEIGALIELGLQHEQQHQELILTDVKHLLSMNPLQPAYSETQLTQVASSAPLHWRAYSEGVVEIGHAGDGFCFDNETSRHRQFLEAFELGSRLVSNGEYLAFIEDGGYRSPALWLSEGWDWVSNNSIVQPLYWKHSDAEGWQEFGLHGLRPLDHHAPAVHLSYFEADAYARWAGARLPSEFEWEHAAGLNGDFTKALPAQFGLHPQAPASAEEVSPLSQLFGTCWQWTASAYAPYAGYTPADGAIGEYNGKFMVNQYVLRGSSCATPIGHARLSYRNFFPANARWQFSGIRLARSRLARS